MSDPAAPDSRPLARALARLVESLGDGLLVVRLSDGRILEANDAQARLLGLTREELIDRSAVDVGVAQDRAELDALATAASGAAPEERRLETSVATPGGQERRVEMAVASLEHGDEACLAIAMRAVDTRGDRIAEQALRASEQRYRGIVEAASDGVWMLDEVDRISFVNRAMADMLGFEVHELLGRRAVEFLADDPEPLGRRALRRQREGGQPRHELRMRRRDGSVLWVEMSVTPLEADGGRYGGAVSLVADMTERQAARLERARLEHRLTQAERLETVGQLAGGIAHDFNNLLAVITNYAYFVREQLPDDSSVRADVDEIRHAAERASELTHQLLVFSRRETVRPVVLDLNAVVRDMDRMLGRTLGPHVTLVTDPDPEPCLVEADPAQLEQVVLNLVVNARDALPGGGGIRVETRRAGAEVVLGVSDDGEGMEPEVLSRAFEPFFTTKPKGAGTGLGLATVYGTVTQAGGHAEIESEPGRGTTVRVHLPAASRRDESADQPEADAGGGDGDGDGRTVLVVEDEDAVRSLTSRILAASGFECLEASGGEEALRLYDMNRDRVDLLLTDVVMPGMSGQELAERIAVEGPGPPVLYMSGYTYDEVLQHSGSTRASPIVHKPFTADSLLRGVRVAMSGSRSDA